jgi:hypothetical protein
MQAKTYFDSFLNKIAPVDCSSKIGYNLWKLQSRNIHNTWIIKFATFLFKEWLAFFPLNQIRLSFTSSANCIQKWHSLFSSHVMYRNVSRVYSSACLLKRCLVSFNWKNRVHYKMRFVKSGDLKVKVFVCTISFVKALYNVKSAARFPTPISYIISQMYITKISYWHKHTVAFKLYRIIGMK